MQTNTYFTTSAFTNPFLSSLERHQRPENIIAILNLFFRPRDFWSLHASTLNTKFSIYVTSDQGPWICATPWCLRLNESCWPRILYRKNYGDKKGSKWERCSQEILLTFLKYCKSRYADLSCSGVHWNFWRMCNALRLGSEVCNWYRLAISPIWRRRSTNV